MISAHRQYLLIESPMVIGSTQDHWAQGKCNALEQNWALMDRLRDITVSLEDFGAN